MNYRAYGTKKTMPRRMTRKTARRDIFVANKKATKARRKAQRLARKAFSVEE